MIVCKFGGSSVADAAQLRKIKQIIDSDPNRTIVIVSAPGKRRSDDEKVTDMLYGCAALVDQGKPCKPIFEKIVERYSTILDDLKIDRTEFDPLFRLIEAEINEGAGSHYAASRGEYLSAKVVASFFGWEFLDTQDLITIDIDGTVASSSYEKIARVIDPKKRYVVPGFYGSDNEGIIRTFSRGGSDITASVFARAVGADVYENWTDVSGIYAIDPRLVENAKVVQELTYQEVRALAGVGANVFHEEAIAPLYHHVIPINIKNTNDPTAEGTWIRASRDYADTPLAGVSAKGGYTRIVVQKLLLLKKVGIRQGLLTMLHVFGVHPTFTSSGIDSLAWYFDSNQANDQILASLCARLKEEFELDEVTVTTGIAIVGVVGEGSSRLEGLTSKATGALAEEGIELMFLSVGSSPHTLLLGVPQNKQKEAVVALYSELF